MSALMEKAVVKMRALPEGEQDDFAQFILAEIESEQCWDGLFRNSQDALARLAEEAIAEDDAGRTERM